MKILFLSSWYASNPPRWLADAFEDLGHLVWRVGPRYPEHGGVDWGSWNVNPDFEIPRQSTWDLPSYLDVCTRAIGPVDFVVASEESYHNEIIPVGNKVPTVLLSWDGWENSFTRNQKFQSVLSYTAHPYGIRIEPRIAPHPDWKFFAPACYPKVHRLLNVPRDIDFTMLATPYSGRPKICKSLREHGLSVLEGLASVDEYVLGYNRGLATYINANGQEEIKWKYMENSACGCVCICDHTLLYSLIGAEPYVHFYPVDRIYQEDLMEEWPTGGMIYSCIESLKKEPTLARFIAKNARDLALSANTYEHRAEMILADLAKVS